MVERLREPVDNVAGMKVSDAPFAKVEPYLLDGLDVFIGAEALIGEGLAAGAAGAVSGLASAFPEVVATAVATGDSTAAGELRATVERFPRHAALKAVVRARAYRCTRTCARRCAASRTRSAPSYSPARRELVDRLACTIVHVGAPRRDVGLGLVGSAARAGHRLRLGLRPGHGFRLRLGELRPQVVRRRGVDRRPVVPPAQPSGDAQAPRTIAKRRLTRPIHRARCYTAAASRPARRAVTRSGVQEAGPIQSMRRRNSGL